MQFKLAIWCFSLFTVSPILYIHTYAYTRCTNVIVKDHLGTHVAIVKDDSERDSLNGYVIILKLRLENILLKFTE